METRIEKDFLGTLEIPKDVYYGVQTARAMQNFPITNLTMHKEMVRALAVVKKSAALANLAVGKLDEKIARWCRYIHEYERKRGYREPRT